MSSEMSVSRIAEVRRQEALDRLNTEIGLSPKKDSSPEDSVAAKARRDAIWAGLLAVCCALVLFVVGLMAIDQEAYSGRTKYGRPVDLVGKQAIGMGVLFISFASLFVGLAAKPFKKKAAVFFAGIGLLGLCTALGILLFR